jgi:hypothetical protein
MSVMQHVLIADPVGAPVQGALADPPPPSGLARRSLGAIWQVWPGSNAPATAEDEQRFVEQLAELAGRPAEPDRSSRRNTTAVLNALRCGLDVDGVLERAPGLRPADLLDAHAHLEDRRRASADAWAAITAERTADVVAGCGAAAARLVPVLVARLASVAETGDVDRLAHMIAEIIEEIAIVEVFARSCEAHMASATPLVREQLGRHLYDLHDPGLWSHTAFLAPRVGTLVPVRVAALLGER